MNNNIYKLNMKRFIEYINKVNPSIQTDLDEDTDKITEVFENLNHAQPEYMIHALIPVVHYALMTWLQSHGYHVDRSSPGIFEDFGKELIKYSKFLNTMGFLHDLTEDDNHEQEEI